MRWLAAPRATLLLLAVPPLGAQPAPRATIGFAVVGLTSDPAFAGIGPTGGLRLTREFGLQLNGLAGRRGDRVVGRAELALRLDFTRPRAATRWYAAGGVAATTGADGGEFILGIVGLERGRRGRWWVEAGVGGGIRLAVGRRWPLGRSADR